MLEGFQEAFIEHVFGFFNTGRVPKTDTFSVTKKLLEQRSLRTRVVRTASLNDTQQVILSKGRRFPEKQCLVRFTGVRWLG